MAIKPLSQVPGYTPLEGKPVEAEAEVAATPEAKPVKAGPDFTVEVNGTEGPDIPAKELRPTDVTPETDQIGAALSDVLQSVELPQDPTATPNADGVLPAAPVYQSVLPAVTTLPNYGSVDIPVNDTFVTPRGHYRSVLPEILTSGDKSGYFSAIRQAESGGDDSAKNPNSTATGRYQFLRGTWNDLVDRYPDSGLTKGGRTDPQQNEIAIRLFTAENENVLKQAGVPIGGGTLYSAHFLGAKDAAEVWKAPAQASLASYVTAATIKANPFLRGMTVGQFQQWAQSKGTPNG
jgi:hypothetical protein